MIEDLLKKLTLKQLGEHLSNYVNLYIKPLNAWKKSIDTSTESYDFVILHIVYFTILILLNVKNTYSAVQIALTEIILTLFPLLIFIIPHRISAFLFNTSSNWIGLFRLLLIIKFQFTPLFYLLSKFGMYSGSEFVFLLLDNSILLIWIGFILIFPLISNLKYWQKIIAITLNYTAFCLFMFSIVFFFSESEFDGKFTQDLALISPSREFSFNNSKFSQSRTFADEKSYIMIGIEKDPGTLYFFKSQFVDTRLWNLCVQKKINDNLRQSIKADSILCLINKERVSIKDSLKEQLYKEEINIKLLDSFRAVNLADYEKDLKLCDSLSNHSKFRSNREYFKKFKLHLDHYGKSYSSKAEMLKIYNEAIDKIFINVENDKYIAVLKMDTTKHQKSQIEYYSIKQKMEKRESKSNLIAGLFFFPFDKILDLCGYYN